MSKKILVDGIMVKPCVGCGFCCIQAPCDVSRRVYGSGIRDCPALKWTGERYICEMCTKGYIRRRYREELYIGKGCCSNLNSWRKEVKPRREQDLPKSGILTLDSTFQKFLFCLGKEWISGDKIYMTLCSLERMLQSDGKTEDEAKNISKSIIHCLRGNRTSFVDGFMGKL